MNASFSRYTIKPLNTDGFSELPVDVQHILYYLTLAGKACHNIVYEQFGPYGAAVRDTLLDICRHARLLTEERERVMHDLHVVLACNGIYHDTQGDRITPSFTEQEFLRWCESAMQFGGKQIPREDARHGLFSDEVPSTLSQAFVWQSGGVTAQERDAYIAGELKLFEGRNAPLCGINLILKKDAAGHIQAQRYGTGPGQLFSAELSLSCSYLENAIQHAAAYPELQESIRTLIRFYQTGCPEDFDAHCLAWIKNQHSPVYFSQGFIERLEDPGKHIGSYQSLVGFKDPKISAQMQKIIDLAQYIEDNLPIHPDFRRTQATGVLGSATRLVSMHGAPAPILPLGSILPNNNWIREKVGSYSTLFINVAEQRGILTDDLLPRFIAPAHLNTLQTHLSAGFAAMVSLHECAGHASGRLSDGVTLHDLGPVYNIIEEARADLVAYYFLGCSDFVAMILPEIQDHTAFCKAMYAEYLSQGTLHQLYRIPAGAKDYGTATHFRSRQLNNAYVLEKALKCGAAGYCQTEFGSCLEVFDAQIIRQLYGELLGELQRIKSTGDRRAAEQLVEQFGTHICAKASADAHQRVASLNPAAYTAFAKPVFVTTGDASQPYLLRPAVNFASSVLG